MSNQAREIKNFLSYVAFPAATKVNIKCVEDELSDLLAHLPEYLMELVQSISNVLPPGTSFQILIMSLGLLEGPKVRLRLFIDVLEDGQMLANRSIFADLDVHFCWFKPESSTEEDASTVLNDIFNSSIGILLQNISRVRGALVNCSRGRNLR